MPCHGDAGQGLTDEFRYQWEPDHQNCWDAGCHSGKYKNDSFPIPTSVPPLAGSGLPARYDPSSLFTYLKTTHPPQDPGLLTDEEYQALVAFLYDLNNAPFPTQVDITTTPPPATPSPSPTPSPRPFPVAGNSYPTSILLLTVGLFLLAVILISYLIRKKP